jgi:hypothetical protein
LLVENYSNSRRVNPVGFLAIFIRALAQRGLARRTDLPLGNVNSLPSLGKTAWVSYNLKSTVLSQKTVLVLFCEKGN